MTSEIRSNTIKNRAGLGTVTFSNTGAVLSGIVTASDDFRANEIKSQAGLGTITVSNTGAVFSGILSATKFVGDGTGLTGNLSYSGNYLGMTDTPSSYTAGAFHRSNNAGNAMQNSATLFEDDQGRIGVGLNSPSSRLHLKQNTDATYMTIECGANNIPYFVGVLGGASSGFYIDNGTTFNNLITANSSDYVFVYGGGQQRLETTNTGVTVSGVLDATGDIQLSDKIYHAGDTNTAIRFPTNDTITFETAGTERLRVDSSGNTTFSGNVSIGGTLTYEDVTNIDSIGIITARSDIKVGTAVTITSAGAGFFAGIVTASSFVKRDGSAVGGVTSDNILNTIGGTQSGQNITNSGSSGTSGIENTLYGYGSGKMIEQGDFNTCIGLLAGRNVFNSSNNTFIGYYAGRLMSSSNNTTVGYKAGEANNTSGNLVAFGYEAATSGTGSGRLTAIGYQAAKAHTGGNGNTYLGYQAGYLNGGGDLNTVIGDQSVNGSSDFNRATVIGAGAGSGFGSNANYNTVVGYGAASSTLTGENNTIIGNGANPSGNVSNEITLGNASVTRFRIPGIGVDLTGPIGITTEALVKTNGQTASLDLSKDDHKVTATGTVTIDVTGGTEASSHTLRIVNSGITTVGFSTYFLFPSGGAPNIPIASGTISLISFTVHRAGAVGVSTQLLSGASVSFA